jgi:[ribosomal protein S5]-alanine N-acetyltransferase
MLGTQEIVTARLKLIPHQREWVQLYLRGPQQLADRLEVKVPVAWPMFPDLFAYVPDPGTIPKFHYFMVVSLEENSLIGEIGYKGDPAEDDGVRMAYAILPEFRQRGFATEALQAVLKHTFTDPDLNNVYVGPLGNAQNAEHVMEGLGFQVVPRYDNDHWWKLARRRHGQ